MKVLKLDKKFADLVRMLVEAEGQLKPATTAECGRLLAEQLEHDWQARALRNGFERAIASANYRRLLTGLYEQILELPTRRPDFLDYAVIERVLEEGLHAMTKEELAVLAVAPRQLSELCSALDDNGLTDYWRNAIDFAMEQEGWPTPNEILGEYEKRAGSDGEWERAAAGEIREEKP